MERSGGARKDLRRSRSLRARDKDHIKFLVAMRLGGTPVNIPNTTVKPETAESTMLETAWEDRWLPESNGLVAQLVRAHA